MSDNLRIWDIISDIRNDLNRITNTNTDNDIGRAIEEIMGLTSGAGDIGQQNIIQESIDYIKEDVDLIKKDIYGLEEIAKCLEYISTMQIPSNNTNEINEYVARIGVDEENATPLLPSSTIKRVLLIGLNDIKKIISEMSPNSRIDTIGIFDIIETMRSKLDDSRSPNVTDNDISRAIEEILELTSDKGDIGQQNIIQESIDCIKEDVDLFEKNIYGLEEVAKCLEYISTMQTSSNNTNEINEYVARIGVDEENTTPLIHPSIIKKVLLKALNSIKKIIS